MISTVGWSYAQTFVAKASQSTVAVGQRLKVTYTLEGKDGNKFIQPTFEGFRLLSGPNTSSSMQWVNGNFSSSKSFSFILQAVEEGKHIIPAASIKTGGQLIQSNTVEVTVTKSTSNSGTKNTNPANKQSSQNQSLSTNIFMKLFLNKNDAYVGEQVIATYKLYVNAQIVNYANNRPVYNGFYAEDVEIDPNAEIETEVINGKKYRVATMKKVVLTPQKSGKLEVSPLEMEMLVRLEKRQRRRSIWDPWASYEDVKYELKSNTGTIEVKPLPTQNQPRDFSGAVGTFKLDVLADLAEVKVNEAVNVTVNIEGRGNIDLMAEPLIDFPQDFESYEPKVNKRISVTGAGTSGKKTFDYVIIPRYAGDFELPPITMSYFDPKSETYKQLKTEPIKLSVLKTANGNDENQMAYVAPKKEDVQIIGNDIRYISSSTGDFAEQKEETFFGTFGYYAMNTVPFAAMALSVLLVGKIRKQEADIGLMKSRKAKAVAKKHLASAKKLLDGRDAEFYQEIFKALYGYIGDKLGISPSDLTKESIAQRLIERGVDQAIIDELHRVLDECEMARFAPGAVRGKHDILNNSATVIEKIEDVA